MKQNLFLFSETLLEMISKISKEDLRYCTKGFRPDSRNGILFFFKNVLAGLIDFSEFEVLYKNPHYKPVAIQTIISCLFLKEIYHFSDRALIENLEFNSFYRYICQIPETDSVLSRRTLSRFRRKLKDYYEETGENLLEKVEASLMQKLETALGEIIGFRFYRIDSTPLESYIRKTTKHQLLYRIITKMVKELFRAGCIFPESLEHYLNGREFNQFFYYNKGESWKKQREEILLEDLKTLLSLEELPLAPSFSLFCRIVSERIGFCGEEIYLKEETKPNFVQSVADPDATYRFKQKGWIGYTVNFVEEAFVSVSGKILGRHIVGFEVKNNLTSDFEFLKDYLKKIQPYSNPQILVCDGAYFSEETQNLARGKNMILIPTGLIGIPTNPFLAHFKLNEEGNRFLSCPGKAKANRESYYPKTRQLRISFKIEDCQKCPYQSDCPVKLKKRVATLTLSQSSINRAKILDSFTDKEKIFLSGVRNGIESVGSQLKNTYFINKIYARGLANVNIWVAIKVLALETTKLFKWFAGSLNEILKNFRRE